MNTRTRWADAHLDTVAEHELGERHRQRRALEAYEAQEAARDAQVRWWWRGFLAFASLLAIAAAVKHGLIAFGYLAP